MSTSRSDLRHRHHTVYRFYAADGRVLYVGCTTDLPQRLATHQSEKPWWSEVIRVECEQFGTDRGGAYARERQLILDLRPQHASGHAVFEGSGIPCAFQRYCGAEADRGYAVYANGERRVYHVCASHTRTRGGDLTWVIDSFPTREHWNAWQCGFESVEEYRAWWQSPDLRPAALTTSAA